MNIKKIGLSALAASLVGLSAQAGEMTVSGTASMTYENYSTTSTAATADNNRTFTQANVLNFAGSGELDNGLTVNLAFELDEGANSGTANTNLFDNHSVSVGSDAMGTFMLAGHGGSSAQSALDTTAAGDIWDNFDGVGGVAAGADLDSSKAGNNIMKYTLPTLADGLSAAVSYQAGGNTDAGAGSSTAYAATYTGVEGLSVSYGYGEDNSVASNEEETTTLKASYAYGSVTVGYSHNENEEKTAAQDQEVTSYSISYSVSDDLSITYGEETFDDETYTVDAEYSSISAAYTTGGMTVTAGMQSAENANGNATDKDVDYNYLGFSFAF